MSPHLPSWALAPLPLLLASLLGCPSTTTGTAVPLTFDGGSCDEHPEVYTVDYQLFDADGASVQRVVVASCGDAALDETEATGPFTLEVWTFDEYANLGMRGTCTVDDLADPQPCAVSTYTEPLVLDLQWDLDLGQDFLPGTCSESEFATFDWQLIDVPERDVLEEQAGVPCADELDWGPVRPGNFILHVDAYASDGTTLLEGFNCIFGTSPYGVRSWCRLAAWP